MQAILLRCGPINRGHIAVKSQLINQGDGPGAQTRDGCSVELYTRLPVHNEPEIISAYLSKGSSILEMGCGVGRVTQSFQTEMLSQDQIGQALNAAGLAVKKFIDSHWVLAARP